MKRLWIIPAAAVLGASLLFAGCGQKKSSAPPSESSAAVGNTDAFSISEEQLSSTLGGAWVDQNSETNKLQFTDGLSFTHEFDGESHTGKATLNGQSGMLTFTYDDGWRAEKSYIWVDSLQNAGANTWYIDGGTFACGGTIYIRDNSSL